MAYTNIWNAAIPTGTEAANTIATIFRTDKVNVQDRFMDIFSIPDFTLDPLRPYNLKFSTVPATNDFLMGAANVRFRDSTNAFTNLNISDTGVVTVRAGLVLTAGNLAAVSLTLSSTLGVTGAFTGTSGTFSTTLGVTGTSTLGVVNASGLISGSAGLTISAGTSTLQALTATTGNYTGLLQSIGGGSFSGNSNPVAGQNIEIRSSGGTGVILSYDRTGIAYLPLIIGATSTTFTQGGLTVSSGTSAFQALTAVSVTIDSGMPYSSLVIANSTTSGGVSGSVQLRAGNSHIAWLIGAQYNLSDTLEFTPATANGGTTFATAVLSLTRTSIMAAQAVTISAGGLTVSAGTTSLQALTVTTGAFNTSIVMASTAPIQWTNATQQIAGNVATGNIAYTATTHTFNNNLTISAGGLTVTGLTTLAAVNMSGILALPASLVHTAGGLRLITGNGTNLNVLYSGGGSGLNINNQNNSITIANFGDTGSFRVVTGTMSVGSPPAANFGYFTDAALSGGTTQFGAGFAATGSSAATGSIGGVYTFASTQATVFTCANTYGIFIGATVLGAGSIVTTNTGLYIAAQTIGGTNYAIYTAGTAQTFHGGPVGINGKTPVANVAAPTAAGGAYTATEQALLNDIRTRLINFGLYT